MWIYVKGKKLINLRRIAYIRVDNYTTDREYIVFCGEDGELTMVGVEKGEGVYFLRGVVFYLKAEKDGVIPLEEIIAVGKSNIEEVL
jgi:CTP:phosphocholine cytidylyltransferase-like protein